MTARMCLVTVLLLVAVTSARATANHLYGANEYDTVMRGISPDNKWAITTHGGGDYGYDNFHVYLTDNVTGKKIGPLEEIVGTLDTGANAFCAQWSADSTQVTIIYRISRHEPLKAMSYRIDKRRAFPLTKAPTDVNADQQGYWTNYGSTADPSPKVFGTPAPQPTYQ
jgi:hypothetical protein